MYCKKCGKLLSDGAKFCDGCGAPQNVPAQSTQRTYQSGPTQQTQQNQQNRQAAGKKKGGAGWLVIVAVCIVAWLIGNAVGQDLGTGMGGGSSSAQSTSPGDEDTSSVAYKQFFTSRGILKVDSRFAGLDSAAYVMEDSDGVIDCMEFGYQGDTVHSSVETIYLDISDFTEAQREELDSSMRGTYGVYESLDFVTISYHLGTKFYSISIRMEDLDKSSVLQSAVDNGLLSITGPTTSISMSETEKTLKNQGYIAR